jgi:hypothetical protein
MQLLKTTIIFLFTLLSLNTLASGDINKYLNQAYTAEKQNQPQNSLKYFKQALDSGLKNRTDLPITVEVYSKIITLSKKYDKSGVKDLYQQIFSSYFNERKPIKKLSTLEQVKKHFIEQEEALDKLQPMFLEMYKIRDYDKYIQLFSMRKNLKEKLALKEEIINEVEKLAKKYPQKTTQDDFSKISFVRNEENIQKLVLPLLKDYIGFLQDYDKNRSDYLNHSLLKSDL